MLPQHQWVGYDTITWHQEGASWAGSFSLYEHPTLANLGCDVRFIARPMRPLEPTLLLRLGGMMAARIDINGPHNFDGVVRRVTHKQWRPGGNDSPQETAEFAAGDFPPLSEADIMVSGVDYEPYFRAAAAHLNVDVAAVDWFPPPNVGGLS